MGADRGIRRRVRIQGRAEVTEAVPTFKRNWETKDRSNYQGDNKKTVAMSDESWQKKGVGVNLLSSG